MVVISGLLNGGWFNCIGFTLSKTQRFPYFLNLSLFHARLAVPKDAQNKVANFSCHGQLTELRQLSIVIAAITYINTSNRRK